MKPILHTPNSTLISFAKPVTKFDYKLKNVISEMKETLIHASSPKGVGLAAPQIGVSLQIFIMRPKENEDIRVFLNPKITWKSKKLVKGIQDGDQIEGCLSLPQVWGLVIRHEAVKLEFLNEQGKVNAEKFSGFPAVIVQHEVDHLNGILFTKRVIEQKGQLFKPGKNEKGEEVLVPIEI